MKAAVLHAPGDIRVQQVAVPQPGPGEVLLRIAACGVCGSDLARMTAKGTYRMPMTCGHEFSAHIAGFGSFGGEPVDATGAFLSQGDLVTVPPMLPCFRCGPCAQGEFSLCEDYDYYGSRRDGAYAEYVAGPARLLLKVPPSLDPRAAAMVDPAAIALHALWRTKLRTGSSVAVVGAGGPIGLFALQWARLAGAGLICGLDVSPEKAELIRRCGAGVAASSDTEAMAATDGDGYDVVVECSGNPTAEDQAVGLAARHGDVVFIGIPNAAVTINDANFARFMRLEIKLIGAWNSFSAPFPGAEWTTTVAKLSSGELEWDFMITHELGLDDVPSTITAMADRSIHSSKVLFIP